MGETITLQRRSTKITLSLSLFGEYDAFRKHVRDSFKLGDEETFVVTDFDRETVLDAEVYLSMRSGEYWQNNPTANRLFMVLDNVSAPLEGDVELEVNYQPHFNTITKTGEANFSKVPHAVAELIDNSIQATDSNAGKRLVEVEVEIGTGKRSSFLVVRDNGRGMNAKGLKDFATYFLTQENRGVSGPQAPTVDDGGRSRAGLRRASAGGGSLGAKKGKICSGFISKFGVGALQAGFYIGSCLTVVTKTALQPQVYEFVMDEAEYERRAMNNTAMFKDKIRLRNAGKKSEDPEAERVGPATVLLDRLREQEKEEDHFTYIVLTLRDKHVEWFTNHERGSLKRELASIYHYYLHPEHCPDGIRRDEVPSDATSGGESETETPLTKEPLEIMYTQKTRQGQSVTTKLADVTDDLESRLHAAKRDSFVFSMEMLHPMQNLREEARRLPVTGVIHYYPYDGERETRPQVWRDEEDDDAITIEAFWEGRLVPESHASALSFFPESKLKKKDREAIGVNWKRRVKGMLFFDWHFPISNNKLKLQFPEGDLHTALTTKNILPKPPAVIYSQRVKGRVIEKDFREWLIKCHETLDREYRFDDKMPTSHNATHDKWRKMTFGKGEATFSSDERVKLPNKKPQVYGKINYFLTEVEEDEEEGRHQAQFSLQRYPEEVFGDSDSDAKIYPVTELDPEKSKMSDDDWNKEMYKYEKQMPASSKILMKTTQKHLPKRLTIRTGKQEATKVSVQILDHSKKPIVTHPNGKGLRVHAILERADENGGTQFVFGIIAKPFMERRYTDTYYFDSMNIKEPGDYTWTIAVALDGVSAKQKEQFLFSVECIVTVLPGNPTKLLLEGEDWDSHIALGTSCWLPALTVRLRDASKCTCPIQAYSSVSIKCMEEGAIDVLYKGSGSSTHEVGRVMNEEPGPLEYDEHAWKLVPISKGLLSEKEYMARVVEFEMTVMAHIQKERADAADVKEFKSKFEVTFEPGAPAELVLLNADPDSAGSFFSTATEAGARLPPLSLGTLDAAGNRTAPSQNETWLVSLEITSAQKLVDGEEGPEFVGPASAIVSGAVASFDPAPEVKWDKDLKTSGETAMVEAVLRIGTQSRDAASAAFPVTIKPSTRPARAVVCQDGRPLSMEAGEDVTFDAGSVVTGLHLRLLDQGGKEVSVTKDTFKSSKEAITCTWAPSWKWPGKAASKTGRFDVLPNLEVPTQLSRLGKGGVSHAKLTLFPKECAGKVLSTSFSFAVRAGPVDHWLAVRADSGKPTDSVGTLVATTGLEDNKPLLAAFAKVVKGFIPVDKYGNPVKNVQRGAELRLEGMPCTRLLPEHRRELVKPTVPGGYYMFPRSLNLIGPPCEGGSLVIVPRSQHSGHGGAGAEAGAGSASDGGNMRRRELRLPVHMRAGPPKKLLIRSTSLGSDAEFSNEIHATFLAGFEISDLQVSLVDTAGNPCALESAIKVFVTPRQRSDVAPSSRAPRRPDYLSSQSTEQPTLDLPAFTLDMKLFASVTVPASRRSSTGSSSRRSAKAARVAARKDGVVELAVRVEGAGVEGVEEACIHWKRVRTNAVTTVHLRTLKPAAAAAEEGGGVERDSLEKVDVLPAAIGKHRRSGVNRPVDGPLPSLVVWVETDNETPFTPPTDSINLDISSSGSSGSRSLTNSYEAPVEAQESLGCPNALVFRPKRGSSMEDYEVGDHVITCSYVEKRSMPGAVTQGESEEQNVEMSLNVVAGTPFKMVPVAEDAHLFHALSASNQRPMAMIDEAEEEARSARQLVDTTFRFTAHDLKGNRAGGINGPVRMRIETLEGQNVPEQQRPRLQNSDSGGYVRADATATGVFLFEETWLEAGVGTREGDYLLVVDSEGDPHLEKWSTCFRFDTDQARLENIQKLNRQLQPLQKKMEDYECARHAAQQTESAADRKVRKVLQSMPEELVSLLGVESDDAMACLPAAKSMLEGMKKEQADRDGQRARPMRFEEGRLNQEDEARINPIGYIAELGYVENEEYARLLSQKAGSKMKSLYVKTGQQMMEARRARASAFCEETVVTFRVGTGQSSRGRNAEEIAAKKLPLRPIKDRGFVDYLANMIQLPDHQEGLRDTIFHAIYGNMVMFDTNANAFKYQKSCKQKNVIPLSILVKEDGTVLERTGYMAANRGASTMQNLKVVYGAMPETLKPEYAKTETFIKHLQYLIPVLGDLEEAVQATVDVCGEHDPETWADEIQTLTTKITLLVGGSRRASTVSTRSTAGAGANGATPKVKQTFKDKERKNSSGGEASNTRFPKRPRR